MLYILSGNIQIGKSRWLEQFVGRLEKQGVSIYGVLAPGVWVSTGEADDSFEKLGIDNVILPSHERVRFATRRDLFESDSLKNDGLFCESSDSSSIKLGWAIHEESLLRVNNHFSELYNLINSEHLFEGCSKGILIIDELGRLELFRDAGLTNAVKLLEEGPTNLWQNALVVARHPFEQTVADRFSCVWGGYQVVSPSCETADFLSANICR